MRVIPPINLYSSGLVTSSTVAEPDTTLTIPEQVWLVGSTYALNDQVIETTNHRKYQSLQASNIGHVLPNYAVGETSNAWWIDIGSSNKWAMFDLLRNTPTVQSTSPLTTVITPGQRVNSLALLGLSGQTVTITGTSGGVTVYGPTVVDLRTRDINNWYDYFFDTFGATPSVVKLDIPSYGDIILTITLANPGGSVSFGTLALGSNTYIGDIEFNPISDAINFSTVTRDIFGNATLIPRRSVPKTTQKIFAASTLANTIRTLRALLNAQVAVWVGLDDVTADYGETMLIIGFYRSWTLDLTTKDVLEQTLEIEEI